MPERPARHLLVVTTNYAETRGGVEMHLANLLPLLVERGVAVTVVYLGDGRAPWTEPSGVRVVSVRRRLDFRDILALPGPGDWRRFTRSLTAAGATPVTHVATHTRFFPLSWMGVRLARRLRVPSIHTEHGGGFVVTSSPLVRFASRVVDRTLGRRVLRGADRVLGVSTASAAFVRELGGVEAGVFGNGIALRRWLADDDLPPATGDGRRLVFIGRVVEEKGWRTFLDVVAACRADGWRGEAWLVGPGPDLDAARVYAETLGVHDLHTPGRLEPDEVRRTLRGAICVNPSVAAEGFQLTQLEALAAGASLVSYRVGIAAELADIPGAAVAVVPRGDREALIEAARADLGRPAPQPTFAQLSAWDWDQLADRYVDELDRL